MLASSRPAMAKRIPKAVGLVACVVTTLIATQSPAHANPFPNNGDSAVADNGVHTYCYTSGFTTDTSVAAMPWRCSATRPTWTTCSRSTRRPASSWRRTCGGWSQPAGRHRGMRDCWLESPAGICTSSDIKLDFAEIDSGTGADWEDRRKTAVHEVGHSVGLGHDTISAMKSGEIPDSSLTWRRYSAHDIVHINGEY